MKEKQKPPRQHSLDRFQQWSMKVIEESENQKGDHENEKKEIEETAEKGSTANAVLDVKAEYNFNPRLREGGDRVT